MTRLVRAQPLTPEAFAPYGDVVSAGLGAGSSANQGTAVRFDWAAALSSSREQARPNLAVFRALAQSLPFDVRLLEKHPCSTQTFLPMLCAKFLVCVAKALPGGEPDASSLTALLCGPGQGISYRADVWHHPILALDGPAEFAMLAWEDGSALDCVEWPLEEFVRVVA